MVVQHTVCTKCMDDVLSSLREKLTIKAAPEGGIEGEYCICITFSLPVVAGAVRASGRIVGVVIRRREKHVQELGRQSARAVLSNFARLGLPPTDLH
jgi:hypothetical protein